MAHTRKTLMLDRNWDLCLEKGFVWREKTVNGATVRYKASSLKLAEGAYATAQNVANECRLFTNDAYFEQDRGIPYYLIALGHKLSPSVLRARLRDAAELVEDVQTVTGVELESLDTETRKVTGEIQFTSKEGERASVEF